MTMVLTGALLAGPVALVLTVLNSAAVTPAPAAVVRDDTAEQAAVSEFAQQFVLTWLRSARGQEPALGRFLNSTDVTLPETPRVASDAEVSSVEHASSATWTVTVGVTVAATFRARSVRQYFQVPILVGPATADLGADPGADPATGPTDPSARTDDRAGASGGSGDPSALHEVALTLPMPVPEPARADSPRLDYPNELTRTDAPFAAVEGFLSAFLTGAGDVSRYLTPGVRLVAVTPAPYASIDLLSLYSQDTGAGIPADGTQLRLLADVTATPTGGPDDVNGIGLQYALTLTARAGRWEITAIDDQPAIHDQALPNPGITTTTTPTTTAPSGATGPNSTP